MELEKKKITLSEVTQTQKERHSWYVFTYKWIVPTKIKNNYVTTQDPERLSSRENLWGMQGSP